MAGNFNLDQDAYSSECDSDDSENAPLISFTQEVRNLPPKRISKKPKSKRLGDRDDAPPKAKREALKEKNGNAPPAASTNRSPHKKFGASPKPKKVKKKKIPPPSVVIAYPVAAMTPALAAEETAANEDLLCSEVLGDLLDDGDVPQIAPPTRMRALDQHELVAPPARAALARAPPPAARHAQTERPPADAESDVLLWLADHVPTRASDPRLCAPEDDGGAEVHGSAYGVALPARDPPLPPARDPPVPPARDKRVRAPDDHGGAEVNGSVYGVELPACDPHVPPARNPRVRAPDDVGGAEVYGSSYGVAPPARDARTCTPPLTVPAEYAAPAAAGGEGGCFWRWGATCGGGQVSALGEAGVAHLGGWKVGFYVRVINFPIPAYK